MSPPILVRMVIGYLAIFVPMAAVSAYAISNLSIFHRVTGYILHVDNRMRDYEKKLADSILAQVRYERKYVITKDEEFHNQFLLAEKEVNKSIAEAVSVADTAPKREVLTRIRESYDRYNTVFQEELEFVKTNRPYPQDVYKDKKDKALDEILEELKNLRLRTESHTYEKIKHLGDSGEKAYRMAILMGTGFIILGIMISIFITRSITRPLSFMRRKARQVAGGDFESTLDLCSPPEIGDLAQDFNLMCNKLKEMDNMKSEFFSLMAHELRTPLASIKEGTNLLQEGISEELKEKWKKVLAIIDEESNRLIDLVNSLLDLSRMEADMMVLNFERSDIRPLINAAVSGSEPLAMSKNVRIHVDMPEEVPDVKMDAERILQALRNLMGNALNFTPNGGRISVSVRLVEGDIRVSVTDTGPGIPKEDLDAIFEKFRQAATANGYRKAKGTGLGLAIVKQIIHAHGGKVWAESESGYGSTFIFHLPACS